MRFLSKVFCCVFLIQSFSAFACTEFRLQAKDKTTLISRTMEFGADLNSSLKTSNRNRKFSVKNSKGQNLFSWNAKYGYVYFDGFNFNFAVDGMNEKGLSFGALYLPGFTSYQKPIKGKENKNLPYFLIGDWILSNFSSVAEVRKNLKEIRVIPFEIPNSNGAKFPLHFSVYDSKGRGLVIEYVNHKLYVYNNVVGVLTNSPNYSWHINNLQNYLHLNPYSPASLSLYSPVDHSKKVARISPNGQGFGLIGLPGDPTPPSRFVKIASLLRFVTTPTRAPDTLNLATHIMNNVDIPAGLVRDRHKKNKKVALDTTQWTTFKDLTNKILYFKTYENVNVRGINLNKIDFSPNAKQFQMKVMDKQAVPDITAEFLSAKNGT